MSHNNSDELLRKKLKPKPTIDQVQSLLDSNVLPVKGTVLKELDSYDDANFLVDCDGSKYLIKVLNGVETRDYRELGDKSFLYFQESMVKYLLHKKVPVPSLLESKDSMPVYAKLPTLGGSMEDLIVSVFTFLPGRTLSSLAPHEIDLQLLYEVGQLLGQLSHALDELTVEQGLSCNSDSHLNKEGGALRFHAWDTRVADATLKQFIDCLADEKTKQKVKNVLYDFKEYKKNLKNVRWGIIHSDFNDANLIIDDDRKLSGLIDFGDSLYSWRMIDLTNCMAYMMMNPFAKENSRSLSCAAAVLRGFHKVYKLSEEEISNIRLLMTCRLAVSHTVGIYSYSQQPENEYLLLHSKPSLDALNLLTDSENLELVEIFFKTACSSSNESHLKLKDLSLTDEDILKNK